MRSGVGGGTMVKKFSRQKFCATGSKNDNFWVLHLKTEKFSLPNYKMVMSASAVPIGAAGGKFSKFGTFSCIFKLTSFLLE